MALAFALTTMCSRLRMRSNCESLHQRENKSCHKPYSIRYDAVNAMLLNEFLKEHRKVETLEETVAQLKVALKEQAAQIQKVSAEVQAVRARPRLISSE
jgi:hypothetical protein